MHTHEPSCTASYTHTHTHSCEAGMHSRYSAPPVVIRASGPHSGAQCQLCIPTGMCSVFLLSC